MSNMSTGLRQRPTYSELNQEITIDKKIELPNRRAKFLRDSHYLTFLDSTFAEMDDQQLKQQKQIQTEHAIREQAAQSSQAASELRARQQIQDSGAQVDTLMLSSSSAPESGTDIDMLPVGAVGVGGDWNAARGWLPDLSPQLSDIVTRNIEADAENMQMQMDQTGSLAELPRETVRMDSSWGQQKRNEQAEPIEATPKAKARVQTDTVVPAPDTVVPASAPDTVVPASAPPKAKAKGTFKKLTDEQKEILKEKKEQGTSNKELASLRAKMMIGGVTAQPTQASAASSSTEPAAPADTTRDEPSTPVIKTQFDKQRDKQRKKHGTQLDTNQNKKHWDRSNLAYIIDQLQLRDVRLTPEQLKGKNRLRKHELIDMVMKAQHGDSS